VIPRFTTLSQTMLREDSSPSRPSGRSREACPPKTRHGTARPCCACPHRLSGGSRAVPRLCPVLPWLCCQWLGASAPQRKRRRPCCPGGARCQPSSKPACAGLLRAASLLAVSGRKCVIANHPAMIATSQLALLSRALRPLRHNVLARAHNGLPAFRLSGSSSQRLPASRGFTNHSTTTTAAGSLASIHRPDRAGRGSTTSCCCARACQADSKLCPCNMQCNMLLAGIYHVSNQHCSQSASLSHLRCSRSELFSPSCIGEIIA
jgi:hypothetical protein